MTALEDYSRALDYLAILARQEFAGWWQMRGEGRLTDRELRAAFADLVAKYGEQAAWTAVDYLVLARSLDDDFAGLAFPEVADPVGFEQAEASFDWAMSEYNKRADAAVVAVARAKLEGVLGRLVVLPARETVVRNVLRDGTAYARVPEPGACGFCLMLASRGAVYTRETVGRVNKYHDHCRCLGIEVRRDGSNLPRINQDLQRLDQVIYKELGYPANAAAWDHYRRAAEQQAAGVEWPLALYARVPKYTKGGMSPVFEGERLPSLDKMVGHVLHGWRDDERGKPHTDGLRLGHRWDTKREGASKFPAGWTDQQIVDAVRDVIEFPTWTRSTTSAREVWGRIDGELVYAKYLTIKGRERLIMAYPIVEGGIPPRALRVGE